MINLCAAAPPAHNTSPTRAIAAAMLLWVAALSQAWADLPSDYGKEPASATLAAPASKHWVWVNDFVFGHMADGMAHLVDGDSGRYLGTLSTGYSFTHIVLSRDGKTIYSPETYFSRGTRGERTDVITLYDPRTLEVTGEIPIPPKRSSNTPVMGNVALTDDDRFLLLFNFNPGASVSVVDTVSRQFVGEIEIPGCALVYPTGPRSFFTLCGDGGAQLVTLDEDGRASTQNRTSALFDVNHDPVTEKPVRLGNIWYFVSFDGRIYPVTASPGALTVGAPWWLTTADERRHGWRPGGLQQLAVHAGQNRLYVIMHQGGRDTHKDPGKVIWIYDLATTHRVQAIQTRDWTGSIQVTADDRPILFGVFADSPILDVYDTDSGRLLKTVKDVATTPTVLVVP